MADAKLSETAVYSGSFIPLRHTGLSAESRNDLMCGVLQPTAGSSFPKSLYDIKKAAK